MICKMPSIGISLRSKTIRIVKRINKIVKWHNSVQKCGDATEQSNELVWCVYFLERADIQLPTKPKQDKE